MYDWQYLHSPNHPVFVYADDAGVVTTVRMAQLVRAVHRAGRRRRGKPLLTNAVSTLGTLGVGAAMMWYGLSEMSL